jgi:hypothetical protein
VNGARLSDSQDLGSVHQLSADYDVIFLSETRHLNTSSYAEYFPTYCIFDKPAASSVRGQGVMVLVSLDLKDHVGSISVDNSFLQVLCIKFDKALFGGASEAVADLYISGVYIPPVGSPQLQDLSLSDSYMHLTNLCQMVHAGGGVHVMGGDFNAHVDHIAGEGVNEAGNNLVELAGNCALSFSLETSRENPTFHTHRGDIELRSCPDHVLGSGTSSARTRMCP